MAKTRKRESARQRAWRGVFFLYLSGVLEGERHGAVLGTVLTAFTIHLFKPKTFSVAF